MDGEKVAERGNVPDDKHTQHQETRRSRKFVCFHSGARAVGTIEAVTPNACHL